MPVPRRRGAVADSSTPTTSIASAAANTAIGSTGSPAAKGFSREEAIALIRDWDGPAVRPQPTEESKTARALELWARAYRSPAPSPSATSPRPAGIDIAKLPVNVSDSLRFLARCPFGAGPLRPCLLALMRDPESDRADRDSTHRARAPGGPRSQDRPLRPRSDRRNQAVAGRIPAGRRRGPGDDARGGHPYSLSRRPAAAGLVGGVERRPEPIPRHPGGRAADRPGRSRRQRGRPGCSGTLPRALDPRRPYRRAAHAETAGADFNDLIMPEHVS